MQQHAVRSEASPLVGWQRYTVIALLLLGAALLLYRFPAVPVGLHQDEMSEAYESYAILHTARDRWGYFLPVYFLSWGSGQNVLQAYLNVPFVAVLGLTRLSARLLPLLLNVACLPFFFFSVRRWYGALAALVALAFLVLSPWHIMVSRWGIENSPLPFFLALGLWSVGRALESRSASRIVPSLIPFGLVMYTYGLTVIAIPTLIVLLLWRDWPSVRASWRSWVAACVLLTLLAAPLAFYTYKNYVSKRDYAFERHLPVSVPLLPATRLQQAKADLGGQSLLRTNVRYVRRFLYDAAIGQAPWYQLPDVRGVQPLLTMMAGLTLLIQLVRGVRARLSFDPFASCIIAFVPVALMIPINSSRAGFIFLPILALAALGTTFLFTHVRQIPLRYALGLFFAACILVPMFRFCRSYYGPRYAELVADTFYPHMPIALSTAERTAGSTAPIYISDSIALNYVDVLFLKRVDPVYFQHSGATWNHPDFGRYRFLEEEVPGIPHPFAFLLAADDDPVCSSPTAVQNYGELVTGLCP